VRRYPLAAVMLVVLLLLLLLLVPAVASRAAVSITKNKLVVRARGAAALVNRDPFQLRILAGSGVSVLSEIANRTPGPTSLPPTMDPVPPGTDAQPSGQLYAPLSFLVGQESISQYSGSVWGGDLMSGVRSGVQYSARDVIAARRLGSGVSLTISTDDPSGRTLRVAITPAGNGLIRVDVTPHPATGVAMMSDSFASSRNEAFYGFGGRHDSLDQHGRALSSWVEEENLPGLGVAGTPSAVLYPNGATAAYYPQAQFISSRGYGFALTQPQLVRFRMDSACTDPGAPARTPWSYDRQTVSAYRALSLLHQRAAPLILRLWRAADRTGIPPTRPLWLEFPSDRQAAAQQQEWTLGDDVLVAPVVTEGARSRTVYFPAGCWRDPDTHLTERGPRSAVGSAPLTRLPYFFRCGTDPFPTAHVGA